MLISENIEKYEGKLFSHFEDEFGNKISYIAMLECLVIVFADESKIKIAQDWRGGECYLSQYESE